MSREYKSRLVCWSTFACLVGVVIGCSHSSPPPRTPNDTSSETGMPEPMALDQLEPAIERAAQYLASELPRLPAVKDSPNQLVLALPPSLEHDARFPDGRLRAAMQLLRNRLQDDPAIKNSFVVISSTELESNSTMNSMQGDAHAFRDPLQREADRTHAGRYDPDAIYLLSGRFYQLTDQRAGQREYKLMFHVDHTRSRQQVLQKEIDILLRWDGEHRQWVPAWR